MKVYCLINQAGERVSKLYSLKRFVMDFHPKYLKDNGFKAVEFDLTNVEPTVISG